MARKSPVMTPERLKAWREGQNLTLAEAAEKLDISYSMYRKTESGERRINRRFRLSCWALMQGVTDFDGKDPIK